MAAAPRTLDSGEDFDDIEEFLGHIYVHLQACALTKPLAPPFGQLLADLDAHRATRRQLVRTVAGLAAQKIFADDGLDALLDEIKAAFGADKSPEAAAVYADKDVFGDESPSAVRRYVLGPQLEKMRNWPGKLAGLPGKPLQDAGSKLAQAIPGIDKLLQDLGTAEVAVETFDVGPRAAFVEACNAAVKLVYGKLSEIEHDPPAGPLPSGFVDRFFLRDTSGRAPRIQELTKAVARTKDRLKRQEAQLQELQDKRAKELKDKQDAELAEMTEKAANAKKLADEANAKLAAIQAEIAQKKPNGG